MTKEELITHLIGTTVDEDKTSVFNTQHVMTNTELINQVWGYAAEILKNYVHSSVVVYIGATPASSNGVRLVVALADSEEYLGYACTLHAVSRRRKLMEKICDMFEAGPEKLSDEDYSIAIGGRP